MRYNAEASSGACAMKWLLFLVLPVAAATAAVAEPQSSIDPFCGELSAISPLQQRAFNAGGMVPRGGVRKTVALLSLRRQALEMQAGDGGALTPEHRADLQARLDAIQHGRY